MAGSDRAVNRTGGDRDKSLETALAQIERQFGRGSIMRLGDEGRAPMEVIPTGAIALDVALGIGGLPRGRVVEVYGPEGSGKTTIALHAVASAQKAGGIAAFIDAEHALDPEYAKKLGVDTDALLVSQPDTGEQALEIADMLIRSGAIDVVVIDSVAALVPRAEIEGEMGDSHVGLQARLMSQALRKITGALSQTKTTAIFINQLREKVGVMFGSCMIVRDQAQVTRRCGGRHRIETEDGKIVDQRPGRQGRLLRPAKNSGLRSLHWCTRRIEDRQRGSNNGVVPSGSCRVSPWPIRRERQGPVRGDGALVTRSKSARLEAGAKQGS